MRLTRIVVDGSSDLEEDFVKRFKVTVIPFNVINRHGKLIRIVPGEEVNIQEGIFDSKDSFFKYIEKVKKKDDIPTTGAVSVERCKHYIRQASKGKKDVLCLTIPQELSKSYEAMARASELISSEVGNRVKIVDSRQAFSAQYFAIKEAAEMAEQGTDVETIAEHVVRLRKKVQLLAGIYSFRYLRKGGRVKKLKKAGSYLADFFGLASIITMMDGIPEPLATVSRKKVVERIVSVMEKITGYKEEISVRINYAGEETKKKAVRVEELIRSRFGRCLREISSYQTGPVAGSHAGPYTLAVAVRRFGYEELDNQVLAKMFERVEKKIKRNESTLNRLNIFPVIDADTGKNLLFTFNDVATNLDLSSLKATIKQIVFRACENGTGFSGTGVAAYLSGFSSRLVNVNAKKINAESFVSAMEEGTKSAYFSFRDPKEGTMLSTMRVSARRAREVLKSERDIAEILKEAYMAAVKELLNPEIQEVPILKRKGVVDAGGLGFVYMLEGWLSALGKEKDIEDFITEFRGNIRIQKSSLGYKIKEARHPGLCLKIKVEGLGEKEKGILRTELESLPNPIESPLSSVGHTFHIHVYDEEMKVRVLELCRKYGSAQLVKATPLSQSDFLLLKNKFLSLVGKLRFLPKLVLWSLYWFGLRIILPFREIKLWKRSRDLFLINKGLEDITQGMKDAVFVFDRKGRIKYFNRAAEDYVHHLSIERIRIRDKIVLYLHPEFLREVEGRLFFLGKEKPFVFKGKKHVFKLKQLYDEKEHIGSKLEIVRR
ncbi:MAG: DegV family protein [Candidatus Aminicenantales bacterium]